MSERLTKEEVEALSELCEKGLKAVFAMCREGRCPKMSIPLRPDDEDRVLCEALSGSLRALATIREQQDQIDGLVDRLKGSIDATPPEQLNVVFNKFEMIEMHRSLTPPQVQK